MHNMVTILPILTYETAPLHARYVFAHDLFLYGLSYDSGVGIELKVDQP